MTAVLDDVASLISISLISNLSLSLVKNGCYLGKIRGVFYKICNSSCYGIVIKNHHFLVA